MQSGSATGPPTPTLACRVQRRQTVRAEGRVGEGRAPGPRPGFASSRRTGRCTTPVCDGGKRQPSRFAVAAFVIPDFTTLQRFIAKRRAPPTQLATDRDKGQDLAPSPPRRCSPTSKPQTGISREAHSPAQPGASFAELPSRRSQKKPGQQRDGEGKGRGVLLPPEPAAPQGYPLERPSMALLPRLRLRGRRCPGGRSEAIGEPAVGMIRSLRRTGTVPGCVARRHHRRRPRQRALRRTPC